MGRENKKGMYSLAFESEEVVCFKSRLSYQDARRELIDLANFYFQPMKEASASIRLLDGKEDYLVQNVKIFFKRKRILFHEY